ncbi:hypothetical protein DY000_02023975, partial [Brassica cretica]
VFKSLASKRKRVRKRAKTESPPCDSELKLDDSETLPTPNLAEAETNGETPKPNLALTLRGRSSGCGRSRQNLSECYAFTSVCIYIQEMCEELSRNAADLTYENENLRRVCKPIHWSLKEISSKLTIRGRYEEEAIVRCTSSAVDRYTSNAVDRYRREASTIENYDRSMYIMYHRSMSRREMRDLVPADFKPKASPNYKITPDESTHGVPSWCKEQNYCSTRQRYKGHWQGRQRSSPTSGNLHVSEGSTPKPSGSKRTSSTNSGFLGDEAHKPRCFRRINFRTSGPQEDISVIDGFREDTSNMTKWRDLRPAKSTRNCRTTRPTRHTKVLLPRSCPIDLESIMNGSMEATGAISTTAHIQSTSKVALIPRNLQGPKDKSTGPTGSEHEALESLKFQRRITGDYEFLHDVHRYFGVVRRRISLHASTKGLVPPEEGMRKNAVFTRLLPSMELLHPRVMV